MIVRANMRLFLAVELGDDVSYAAWAAGDRLRGEIALAAPRASIRWLPQPNLHVTVRFLGEVADRDGGALIGALQQPIDCRPFTLRIATAGAFPPTGAPRVIWFGLPAGREVLVGVYDQLSSRLAPLGFEVERRAYNPHLTMARVKDVPRADIRAIRAILDHARVDAGACSIDAVTLFRSRTSPHGAQYERLLRVPVR